MDVPGVGGVLLLELRLDLGRVVRLREDLVEEIDVARVVDLMELPRHGVEQDHRPARSDHRLVPIEVEEVAEAEALDQDRVHDRVHVVRTDVGQADHQDVGLPVHLDQLLPVDVGQCALVDGVGGTGVDPGHPVR